MIVVTRAEWGAAPPKPGCVENRDPHSVVGAVVHYSDALPPGSVDPPTDPGEHQAAAQVRAIQAFHMGPRGWCDIAYHWLIAPDGAVFEGRPIGQVGAHTLGHNVDTVGYCILTDNLATPEAEDALLERIHADRAPLGSAYQWIKPHRDLNPTHCPGDTIAAWVAAGLPAPDGSLPGTAPQPGPPPVVAVDCAALPPGPPPAGKTLLRVGDTGPAVADLQAHLAAAGYPPGGSRKTDGTWDGIFGAHTEAAVTALQADHGLAVDGVCGRQTWCALGVRNP